MQIKDVMVDMNDLVLIKIARNNTLIVGFVENMGRTFMFHDKYIRISRKRRKNEIQENPSEMIKEKRIKSIQVIDIKK